MIREDYPYFYETHLHTCESSRCAENSGEDMARACKKAGYTGIFVTDHNWYGNNCIEEGLSWEQWIRAFCRGYEHARAWGARNDLAVFFGYESCYDGTDFLIYGVDEDWVIRHPEIRDATVKEQHALIRAAGGLVIQAHPFRKEDYIPEIRLFPEDVDGVEGINATHSSPLSRHHNIAEWNDQAIAYTNAHKLPMTAGSDIHSTVLFGGGMAFRRRLTSALDYCRAVREGEDYVLTDGVHWYDKQGKVLCGFWEDTRF